MRIRCRPHQSTADRRGSACRRTSGPRQPTRSRVPRGAGGALGDYSSKTKGADGKPLFLVRNEWRCTTKPGKLHFIVFRTAPDGFVLPTFKSQIKAVTHIDESGKRVPLKVETLPDGSRRVKIPLMAVRDTMGAVLIVNLVGDGTQR